MLMVVSHRGVIIIERECSSAESLSAMLLEA